MDLFIGVDDHGNSGFHVGFLRLDGLNLDVGCNISGGNSIAATTENLQEMKDGENKLAV
ncbi:MAG: hypothetical protein HQL69_20830 [Magnetococcales bacterium]|nr:hypothetical protein [Magnetococcales bacterium]